MVEYLRKQFSSISFLTNLFFRYYITNDRKELEGGILNYASYNLEYHQGLIGNQWKWTYWITIWCMDKWMFIENGAFRYRLLLYHFVIAWYGAMRQLCKCLVIFQKIFIYRCISIFKNILPASSLFCPKSLMWCQFLFLLHKKI